MSLLLCRVFACNIEGILLLFLLLSLASAGNFVGRGTTQDVLLLLFFGWLLSVVLLVGQTRHLATTQTGMNTKDTGENNKVSEKEGDGRSWVLLALSLSAETAVHRGARLQVVHLHTAVSPTSNSTYIHQGTTRSRHTSNTPRLDWSQ
jgi:hypothetical protein